MSTFLHHLAATLLAAHGNDLSTTCIVLPGRRAGVFFRKALADSTDKAIWAPTVRSVEDFVMEHSGLTALDKTTLLFRFFKVYQQHADDPQPIAQFAAWAGSFLADVNEIDLNLLDAEAVFHDLYSVERIARWNPDGSPPSDFQKRHLAFVRQFPVLYKELRKELLLRKEAYQGMAFRTVAENSEALVARSTWSSVVFAGFNALTVSEERIIQSWKESGKGRIYWDMDPHYVDDPLHEAGHYMRRYLAGTGILKLDKEWEWKHAWMQQPKHLDIIAVQRKVTQAKVAASIIQKRLQDDPTANLQRTAIVLNDEQLLIPLLHALPKELRGVNITMGYGLQFSQSAAFIRKLFVLWENSADHAGRLYHRDLAELYQDTFFLAITGHEPVAKLKELLRSRKVSIAPATVLTTTEVERIIMQGMNAMPSGFLSGLAQLIVAVRGSQQEKSELELELEFMHQFSKVVQRLSDLMQEFKGIDDLKTLHVFWRQLIRGVQLDFRGEPLSGLQVMGMLETRNLDFDEVIMLGVNEGNLPSSASSNSYLTYDIRGAFGLARQNERDAVTAYHFYRLMQRTKRVTLIYDQDTDAMGKGEVSRYVRQLQLEKGDNISLKEYQVEQQVKMTEFRPTIIIEKGDAEMARLLQHAAGGFSPSALNMYRSCSLKFYFAYVAGFKEQQEFPEFIDHSTFGSAVHNTLETLYMPYLGKPLSEDALNAMVPRVRTELERQFTEVLSLDESPEGRNLLALEVAITYVQRVIQHDVETIRSGNAITLLKMEEELKAPLPFNGSEVLLKGMADRIDRLGDGTVRIIDYKTGARSTKKAITHPEDLAKSGFEHFFQLLMYGLMYANGNDASTIRPALFYVRNSDMEKPLVVFEEEAQLSGMQLVNYAKERLEELFSELFNPDLPFYQTEDTKRCANCDFKGICQR